MRFTSSILGKLVEPINRRGFQRIVDDHDADAYDKAFRSWDHLMVLIYAQLSGAASLRGLEAGWNANSQHHYHLGSGRLRRSTLADANARRPVAVFAETFARLAGQLDRQARRDGRAMLRLIDSTPVPLGKLCGWAKSNGRIRGMKMHVVYDPDSDCPRLLDITDANVNDAQIGRTIAIESGATYVFDKGYCHYGWWTAIAEAKAVFVTRPKSNMALKVIRKRRLKVAEGDGFTVIDDATVRLASKGDSKLPMPLRRLTVKRADGDTIPADQRSQALRRGHCGALQGPLADRAAVPLDQAASQDPQLPRQQRQRRPPAALRRDDRLCAAAHRRPPPSRRHADPALHRSRHALPLRAPRHRRHRAAAARQSEPIKTENQPKPDGFRLWLNFPRTALPLWGGVGEGNFASRDCRA
ncbi:hypothetical protein ABIA25_004210 [Sinorhizobium fredii]